MSSHGHSGVELTRLPLSAHTSRKYNCNARCIHVVSDIHGDIKHNEWDNPPVDADVVVCAGDAMAPATLAIPYVRRQWPTLPIIYNMGNHDFYSDHRHPDTKTTWEWQRDNAPKVAALHDVHLLDGSYSNGTVEIDGVRFVGGTAWTDFQSYPRSRFQYGEMMRMSRQMNDYRLIKTGRGRSRDVFEPKDSIADHKRFMAWLTQELAQDFDGETVLVTHHSLSEKSLFAGVAIRDLDWCYASNADHIFHRYDAATNPKVLPDHVPPVLAIHGHVHQTATTPSVRPGCCAIRGAIRPAIRTRGAPVARGRIRISIRRWSSRSGCRSCRRWGCRRWNASNITRQWPDATTGLPCLIVRNPVGALCGYVGVSPGHPYYRKYEGDIDVEVHGGLTFGDSCAHGNEEHSICHIPVAGEPDDVWWLGFDCSHGGDLSPKYMEPNSRDRYRDIAYVEDQCAKLAAQLAAVGGCQ